MAVTMTLHNLPEGFAVAFASFTDFGPLMALAVALHNIPEGLIVAGAASSGCVCFRGGASR
jgi:ZIP family zinc transporter